MAHRARLAEDERFHATPAMFRMVIADFDYANSTVAESIMVIIERAADADLARRVTAIS